MTARLRDYKPENVRAARALAEQLELRDVTVEEGDAFDREVVRRDPAARDDWDCFGVVRAVSVE